MTIRVKTMLIVGLTLLGLISLLYCASQAIVLDGFSLLEEKDVQRNIERALNAVASDIEEITFTAESYAVWDETYAFMLGKNPNYVETNYYSETMINLSINFVLLYDQTGKLISGTGYDLENDQIFAIPESLQTSIVPDSPLLQNIEPDSGFSGIVSVEGSPWLVGSHAITNTAGVALPVGTLVMARFLDDAETQYLGETLRLSLALQPFNSTSQADFASAKVHFAHDLSPFIQPLDSQSIAGYAVLKDIRNSPISILRVDTPRDIYLQGQKTLVYSILALVVSGLVFGVVIMFLLHQFVLSPLSRLATEVSHIGENNEGLARVTITGKDEFSQVGQSINVMLERLERSRNEIKQAYDNLALSNAELEKLNAHRAVEQAQKERFFAHLSHELRTPLTNIRMRSYLLERQPEQSDRHFKVMNMNIEDMSLLIDELRDISGIEGGIKLQPEMVDLTQTLQRILESRQEVADRKKVLLMSELPESPLQATVDRQRFSRAINSLVAYAISESDESETVRVQLAPDNSGSCVHIAVYYGGANAELDENSEIFKPFYAASGGGISGMALGLTIAREIIELHQGQIKAEHIEGQGNVFSVMIPIIQLPSQAEISQDAPMISGSVQLAQ